MIEALFTNPSRTAAWLKNILNSKDQPSRPPRVAAIARFELVASAARIVPRSAAGRLEGKNAKYRHAISEWATVWITSRFQPQRLSERVVGYPETTKLLLIGEKSSLHSLPHFQKRRHSWEERESHMRRRERIQQIKTELEALLGRRADLEWRPEFLVSCG